MVQNIYEQIFGQVHHGTGNVIRLFVWVAGLIGWLAVDGVVSTATHHLPAHLVLDTVLILLATTLFFGWSVHFLLAGNVAWPNLILAAAVTAVFWIGLAGFAALYFSPAITPPRKPYGKNRGVFRLVSWVIPFPGAFLVGVLGRGGLPAR